MNIHEKINAKESPLIILTVNQYAQLLERNLIALVPYYLARLARQKIYLAEVEMFKAYNGGRNRWELENGFNKNF